MPATTRRSRTRTLTDAQEALEKARGLLADIDLRTCPVPLRNAVKAARTEVGNAITATSAAIVRDAETLRRAV